MNWKPVNELPDAKLGEYVDVVLWCTLSKPRRDGATAMGFSGTWERRRCRFVVDIESVDDAVTPTHWCEITPPGDDQSEIHARHELRAREAELDRLRAVVARERDQTPVDESFAKSVAVEVNDCGPNGDETMSCEIGGELWLYCVQGDWRIHVENVIVNNPTIGQFWTACRLFGVDMKGNQS